MNREVENFAKNKILLNMKKVNFLSNFVTLKRGKESYLVQTLQSIFDGVSDSVTYGIVLYIGETNVTFVSSVADEIEAKFQKEFENGRIEIISPQLSFYPNFEVEIEKLIRGKVFNFFDDSPERIKWRQKQNLGR